MIRERALAGNLPPPTAVSGGLGEARLSASIESGRTRLAEVCCRIVVRRGKDFPAMKSWYEHRVRQSSVSRISTLPSGILPTSERSESRATAGDSKAGHGGGRESGKTHTYANDRNPALTRNTMQSLQGCEYRPGSWTAVLDSSPTQKPRLRVTGICTCPTGGYEVSLRRAATQGLNSRVLVLEFAASPPSGMANQMMTDHEVRFEQLNSPMYTDVRIIPFDISVPVESAS